MVFYIGSIFCHNLVDITDSCDCKIKHLDLASLDTSENCLGINSTVSDDQPTTFTMLAKNFDKEQFFWYECKISNCEIPHHK